MTITTIVLDKAAFYLTFGCRVTLITGHYPESLFTIEVPRHIAFYERIGGWVPYNTFCNKRRVLKRMARKHSNLPLHFTGDHDTGFKLGDIATIRSFSKKEKDLMKASE